MDIDEADARWQDEHVAYSLAQLRELCDVAEAELRELIEHGVADPLDPRGQTFSGTCVARVRTAVRVRREFALEDAHSVAVVVGFVERIETLRREIARLRALLG